MSIDFADRSYAAPGALKTLAFDFTPSTDPLHLVLALTPEVQALAPVPEREGEKYSVYVLYGVEGLNILDGPHPREDEKSYTISRASLPTLRAGSGK